MIKDILIPEKIGQYFLFSENIVGIDIGKSHINATHIKASGSAITIERCWQESIEANKKSYDERVVETLKKMTPLLKSSSKINSGLPSSQIVFKTLKLPFLSRHKIEMVIHFEVEPLLPFPIQDAVIDFIITKQYPEQKSSEIIVAAVQKKHVAHHLSLFESAGIDPSIITVDMFALYGLYSQIPAYENQTGDTVLIDLGIQSTRLACIRNKQLTMIRSLPHGLSSIAKDLSKATDTAAPQALEQIIRFGITHSDPQFQEALKKALSDFFNKIQFSLNSLAHTNTQNIKRLLLLGSGSEVNGIMRLMADQLGIVCEEFDVAKIKENKNYTIKSMHAIPTSLIMSMAIAIPTPITQDFNLRSQEFAPTNERLILKQLIVGGCLIIAMIGLLFTHLVTQRRTLQKEIQLSENETLDMLKERFPAIAEDEDDLEVIKDAAETELKQEEEMWFAFTRQSRTSFLEYLLELTSRINKQELGFIPDSLTIVDGREGSITLKARVRDFEALKKLEQALRESKLFSFVEGQTSPDFTMKILVGKREDT